MMIRFVTALLLATLLWPHEATAQQPTKLLPRRVLFQVAFSIAWVTDVSAFGVSDRMPLPESHKYLTFATGTVVSQLYQVLSRSPHHVILASPMMTLNSVPAANVVDAKIPDYTSAVQMSNGPITVPKLLGYLQLTGKLVLTPHLMPNNLVVLDINSSNSEGQPIRFQAITSSTSLVIIAPDVQGPDTPILGSVYRKRDMLPKSDELLIFITPMIVPD
jgi:hypothetical protein